MNLSREPIKNWFGFSRRERRSTFILLIIIVLIVGIRYAFPDSQATIRYIAGNISGEEILSELSLADKTFFTATFSTDTDKRSQETINKQGHTAKTAVFFPGRRGTAENFRQKTVKQQKALIDLNTADTTILIKLPGIGPVLSARIIKYRHLLGGYARIDQLKEVYGLSEETFQIIKGRVFADSIFIARININSAGYKELSHFPYLEKYEVSAILKYRNIKGKIISMEDLTENKLINVEKARKISPYINFSE